MIHKQCFICKEVGHISSMSRNTYWLHAAVGRIRDRKYVVEYIGIDKRIRIWAHKKCESSAHN